MMDRLAHMTASNSKQLSGGRNGVFYCPTFPVIKFWLLVFSVCNVRLLRICRQQAAVYSMVFRKRKKILVEFWEEILRTDALWRMNLMGFLWWM